MLIVVTIILLVGIIITLMLYNISIHNKVIKFNNITQQINNLSVLQDFMDTIGEYSTVDEKINKINEILIEKYNIKYSTIVVFNGAEYILKASNVDEKHWNTLKNLHTEPIFKDSIETATPKYVTVNGEAERLPYQKMEFGRAKSAMFFPLYIDNVYIGYWIIESGAPHAFDKIDTSMLEIVKDNIIAVLKTIANQSTIENIVRKDKFSGLQSAEYLYGKGRKQMDEYTLSTVCMLKIINLETINDTISRKLGNQVVTVVSEIIKNSIAEEYIFVRYMGPKFVIVFVGVEPDGVVQFVKEIKKRIEKTKVYSVDTKEEDKNAKFAIPVLNFAISTYYKGTEIDGVTKKLEEYLDTAKTGENSINYI